jgi:hypothetical protein
MSGGVIFLPKKAKIEMIISLLLGIPLGILASLIAWWILFHKLVPVIEFSEGIRKIEANYLRSDVQYKFKISNTGRRGIIDLEIVVKYRVKNIDGRHENIWIWKPLSIDVHRVPMLQKGSNRIFQMLPEKTIDFQHPPFSKEIRTKASAGTLLIEDLMRIGESPGIRIYVFGYDEFSGTRKLYTSKFYDSSSIGVGWVSKNQES